MINTKEKQLKQVSNIFNTLIEATEHFHNLVKKKEFNQSIFIFSSIVEGIDAVSRLYTPIAPKDWTKNKTKIESLLLEITKNLEKGNFIKISEIIQFTLLPTLKKVNNIIYEQVGVSDNEKICNIGVFSSHGNPRLFYPEPRINAMVKESERQNAKLFFFTSNDIDFEKEEIYADVYNGGKWERVKAPFPDVINNVGAGKRSHAERKLRRILPFTSFHVGNKVTLPQRIVKHRKFADLLVPFRLCSNQALIHDFINKNNKVVFKYLLSNRGENIFFITKNGSRYIFQEHKKQRILNQESFNNWLENVVLKEKDSFIVQKYIHTRTKNDEPYHFRAHVQKNGEGKWVLTHIYPRVGNKRSNLSNVATDGRVEDFHTFLIREHGEKLGKKYEEDILQLSIDVAQHLDKLYNLALDELGLDFAIDEDGRYWMHEANNGPQTAYHEEKRAVNTIAYAKYIARNGIYHGDTHMKFRNGLFQSKYSKLEQINFKYDKVIGVLTSEVNNNELLTAYANIANKLNKPLFVFTPKDVDFDELKIRGYFLTDDEWAPKIVRYPDIIIDHLKLRDKENIKWLYEELEDIIFTNYWAGIQNRRSELFSILNSTLKLCNIAAYQPVSKTNDIFRYLEKYKKVIVKPDLGYQGIHYIEQISTGKFNLFGGKIRSEYNEIQLTNKLRDEMKESKFIVQKDNRFVDLAGKSHIITISFILGKEKNWNHIEVHTNENTEMNGYYYLLKLFEEKYNETTRSIDKFIMELETVVNQINKLHNITEVCFEVGLDEENSRLSILDINFSGPNNVRDKKNYAEVKLLQALELAHNQN